MLIITDSDLRSFEAWSGGADTLNRLIYLEDEGKIDLSEVEDYINELYPEGIEDITLNDFLWFDMDDEFQNIYDFDLWSDEEEE